MFKTCPSFHGVLTSNVTEVFCSINDFRGECHPIWNRRLLAGGKSRINLSGFLTPSEAIIIQVLFQPAEHPNIQKILHRKCVQTALGIITRVASYNRFTELSEMGSMM